MIILDTIHPNIKQALIERMGPARQEFRQANPLEYMVVDFDDVQYFLKASSETFTIYCSMLNFDKYENFGVKQLLEEKYNKYDIAVSMTKQLQHDASYDFSLTFDLSTDYGSENEAVCDSLARVKYTVLSAPFFDYFEAVRAGNAPEVRRIPYRANESIYIKKGKEDQIIVVFSVTFDEKKDWSIAEVFLREFSDVRREPSLQNAPVASFSRNPPGELDGVKVEEGEDVIYISFVLFKKHWDGTKAEQSIGAVLMFRNYLHYHVKASKTFMHMRMRKTVDSLMGTLNRAKTSAEAAVEKKTWSGRSLN